MSREAWGDEGNVANHWEETLIRAQMDAAIADFSRWVADYRSEMPGEDFEDLVDRVSETFDQMQTMMSGKI